MTKTERLADNRRRQKVANEEFDRRKQILDDYLNSAKVKKLRKDVEDALDASNVIIYEWNDIIMEDSVKRNSNL